MLVAAFGSRRIALVGARPVLAHHSFAAEFDASKPVTLHGTITKLEWINPHSWLHVDVKNADGTTTEWMVEAATPNTLLRRGFTRDTVKAGTEITVDRLSGEERRAPRQRPRPDLGRRLAVVHGLGGHRRTGRRGEERAGPAVS